MSPANLLVSVIVLNYNGARWLERCLESLRAQTIFDQIEVIVADNVSSDGSERLGKQIVESWPRGVFVQHSQNLGYCEGNNRAAEAAHGQYLLFLNNDTWLEPGCLEQLLAEVQRTGAGAAAPLILNYEDDSFQSLGAFGFDLFGLASTRACAAQTRPVLMPEGCAYLIAARACFRNWAALTRSSSCSRMSSTCPGGSGFPAIRPWRCPRRSCTIAERRRSIPPAAARRWNSAPAIPSASTRIGTACWCC